MEEFLNKDTIGWIMAVVLLIVPAYALITNKFVIGRLSINNAVIVGDKIIYSGSMGAFQNRVDHSRISVCDVETGKSIGKVLLHRGWYSILITFDGVVWARPDKLALDARQVEYNPVGFELSTLKIVSNGKQLKKQFGLQETEKFNDMILDEDTHNLNFTTNSGNSHAINYNLQSAVIPSPWPSSWSPLEHFPKPYSIVKKSGSERFEFIYNKKPLGNDSFLKPVLMNEFYENGVHTGFVFYHLQTLDKCPAISLSMMGLDGKLRWTLEQSAFGMRKANASDSKGHVTPFFAGCSKSILVYAIQARGGPNKLAAIDSKNGKLIWIKSI